MLSSSPSLLLSALSPLAVAGDTAAPATGEAAPGFAELLNGLAAKAVETVSGEKAGKDGAAPTGGETPAPAKGKAAAARAERPTVATKAALAQGKDAPVPAAQPAAATAAAIETGKILPVALPEAAAADGKSEAATEIDALVAEPIMPAATTATPLAPTALPATPAAQASGEPAPAAATPPRRSAMVATQMPTGKVNPAAGQPADKGKPEAPASEPRQAPAVAITVAAPAQAVSVETAEADARPATPPRAKPVRAADLVRIEAPQVSVPAPAAAHFAPTDPSAQAAYTPAPAMPAATPSPSDIDAALDHLVAAREALMPAEAALAIDHAEFGEVSIKFEQSADGRLSAELTAADPELKRAVTAATAAERGPATTSDGDNRSAQLGNNRGSAAAGGDAANGGRSQSGGQPGAERDGAQRRAATHSQGGKTASDQRPGVFA